MYKDSVLTVNGTIGATSTEKTITLDNNCVVNVNGTVGTYIKFVIPVGEVGTGSTVTGTEETYIKLGTDVTGQNITGIVISAGRVTVPSESGSSSTIYQRAYISGTVKLIDSTDSTAAKNTIAISNNTVYVDKDVTLSVNKGVTITATKAVVDGTIVVDEDATATGVVYEGAKYTVTVKGENNSTKTTTYFSSFDAAVAIIDTVDDKTINAKVDKIKSSFTVAADQIISISPATATVSSDAVITVEEDGSISGIAIVEGRVIVKNGATCVIPRTGYAVKTVSDDNTTYSGFKIAIENAQAGDVITVSTGTTTESLTIPSDVKVIVTESLSVSKDLTVSAGAILKIEGALAPSTDSSSPSKINIIGELDLTEGTVSTNYYALTSTGKTTVTALPASPATYNGAWYNTDGVYVITSVAKAVEYGNANDVNITAHGTISEASEIELDGIDLTIDGAVSISKVSLKNAAIIINGTNAEAKITATIVGLTGDGTTTASVEMKKATSGIKSTSSMDAAGVTTYKTTISSISGESVTIKTGKVEFKATSAYIVPTAVKFTVSPEATLDVKSEISLGGDNVVIEGIVNLGSTLTVNGALSIYGTMNVNKSGILTGENVLTVIGSIIISDKENAEGTAYFNNDVFIGEKSKTLGASGSVSGAVTLASGKKIVAYPGTDMGALINVDPATGVSPVVSTKFIVNGKDYATVYAVDGVTINCLNTEIAALEDLDTTAAAIEWYAEGVEDAITNNVSIGQYDVLSSEIKYDKLPVKISAGPGIIVYIDDLKVGNSDLLSIGTHTITTYIEIGYEGTVTAKINGVTINNGQFDITSNMEDITIVVTGAVPAVTPEPVQPEKDDGIGITDYLLVVLVILAAILVVVVAIRMMRS
ncbi:MAG: hypothetical protein IJX35_02920 [Candidatus Methanomethylophilaceae archaeon]|nr:hypothetical protein [Candidatus Methanomethylophilaceae archaeon]